MELQNFLCVPLDYYSITEKLYAIECHPMEAERSENYMDFEDLFNELSLLAAQLAGELETLIDNLTDSWDFPLRVKNIYNNATGIVWFDTASSLVSATDMDLLIENEGSWGDAELDRDKRLRAVKRLNKEQMLHLFTGVFNFLTRYLELIQAYEAVTGVIGELERLRPSLKRDGDRHLPPSEHP